MSMLGAAAIGAAGSMASGLFGGLSANRQAKKNRKFIAEQNQLGRDFQAQQLREQQKFAEEMWNKNNKWNTPAAMMQRFKDAGLNGALMMTQGNMGSAQSTPAQSPGTPSAYGTDAMPQQNGIYTGQVIQGMTDFANNLYLKHSQSRQMDAMAAEANAKAQNVSIDNITKLSRDKAILRNTDASTDQIKSLTDVQNRQINIIESRQDAEITKLNAETFKITQEGIYQMFKNDKFPDEFNQQMAESAARTTMFLTQGDLNRKEAKKVIAETATEWYKAAQERIKARYAGTLQKKLLRELDDNHAKFQEEIEKLTQDNDWYTYDKVAPLIVRGVGMILGAAGGAILGAAAGGVGAVPGAIAGASLGYNGAGALIQLGGSSPRTTVSGFRK